MAKKNKQTTTNTTNLPALRIGTRIRCTDARSRRASTALVTNIDFEAWADYLGGIGVREPAAQRPKARRIVVIRNGQSVGHRQRR